MNLLLDSHIIIWCAEDHPSLTAEARKLIADPDNRLFVSLISLWELYIKARRGRLKLQVDLRQIVAQAGYELLNMTIDDAECAANLPLHHGDPFDRMLVAQALNQNLVLVTADRYIQSYNVPLAKV